MHAWQACPRTGGAQSVYIHALETASGPWAGFANFKANRPTYTALDDDEVPPGGSYRDAANPEPAKEPPPHYAQAWRVELMVLGEGPQTRCRDRSGVVSPGEGANGTSCKGRGDDANVAATCPHQWLVLRRWFLGVVAAGGEAPVHAIHCQHEDCEGL